MGRSLQKREYLQHNNEFFSHPIVYCCDIDGLTDSAVSVGLAISKQLIKTPTSSRSVRLEGCFVKAIEPLPDNVVIRDIDVLFNPNFKVDVLAVLVNAHRKKKFDVVWPGEYDKEKLKYATEEFIDYKVFDISKYDITCVY